ncbi:unnamed protein product [Discosporangium mesarthrocarpum]
MTSRLSRHPSPRMSLVEPPLSLVDRSPLDDDGRRLWSVEEIHGGLEGFADSVDASLRGDLVVIVAYVPWCRSCKAFRHSLRQLSAEHWLKGTGAVFYEMDLHENTEVKQMLRIKSAPVVLMYSLGQQVERFHCSPSNRHLLVEALERQLGTDNPPTAAYFQSEGE